MSEAASDMAEDGTVSIGAYRGFYGSLRRTESVSGRSGFQFFGLSGTLSHEVLRVVEPFLIPLPDMLTQGTAVPLYVWLRLPGNQLLCAQSFRIVDETDDYDRCRGFLSVFYVVDGDDAVRLFEGDPFRLFDCEWLWPQTYERALEAAAQVPSSDGRLTLQVSRSRDGNPADAEVNPLCDVAEWQHLIQQLLAECVSSGERSVPLFIWERSIRMIRLLQRILGLLPADLRLAASFDTGAVAGTGQRRDSALRCIFEGSAATARQSSEQRPAVPPRSVGVYQNWMSSYRVSDLMQLSAGTSARKHANAVRLCLYQAGVVTARPLLGDRLQQQEDWTEVINASLEFLAADASLTLQRSGVPASEANVLGGRYIRHLLKSEAAPQRLRQGMLSSSLLCDLMRPDCDRADPAALRWSPDTLRVCLGLSAGWEQNCGSIARGMQANRRFLLAVYLISESCWSVLMPLIAELPSDELSQILRWSLNYFDVQIETSLAVVQKLLVLLGLTVRRESFRQEAYESLLQAFCLTGYSGGAATRYPREFYSHLLCQLLTERAEMQCRLATQQQRAVSLRGRKPVSSGTDVRQFGRQSVAAVPVRKPQDTALTDRAGEHYRVLQLVGNQLTCVASSEDATAAIPAVLRQRLLREATATVAPRQQVLLVGSEVWALELQPSFGGLMILAYSTDRRRRCDPRQEPLQRLKARFGTLVRLQPQAPSVTPWRRASPAVVFAVLLSLAARESVVLAGDFEQRMSAYHDFCEFGPRELVERVELQATEQEFRLQIEDPAWPAESRQAHELLFADPACSDKTRQTLFARLLHGLPCEQTQGPLSAGTGETIRELHALSRILTDSQCAPVPAIDINRGRSYLALVRKVAEAELLKALRGRLRGCLGHCLAEVLEPPVLAALTDDEVMLNVLQQGFDVKWLGAVAVDTLVQFPGVLPGSPVGVEMRRFQVALESRSGTLRCRLVLAVLLNEVENLVATLRELAGSEEQAELLELLRQMVQLRFRAEIPRSSVGGQLKPGVVIERTTAAVGESIWQAAAACHMVPHLLLPLLQASVAQSTDDTAEKSGDSAE